MSDTDTRRRLADWFQLWRKPLHKFLIRKAAVPHADLEDVSQEVFLRLLRYDPVELVEQPHSYLFKMAHNVAAEWSLRANRRHSHDPKWLDDLLVDDQPEDEAQRASSREEIKRVLNNLSPRSREVLKLRFTEGLGYADIAARTGATPRSVKRCLMKSYEKLRVELKLDRLGEMSHGRE